MSPHRPVKFTLPSDLTQNDSRYDEAKTNNRRDFKMTILKTVLVALFQILFGSDPATEARKHEALKLGQGSGLAA